MKTQNSEISVQLCVAGLGKKVQSCQLVSCSPTCYSFHTQVHTGALPLVFQLPIPTTSSWWRRALFSLLEEFHYRQLSYLYLIWIVFGRWCHPWWQVPGCGFPLHQKAMKWPQFYQLQIWRPTSFRTHSHYKSSPLIKKEKEPYRDVLIGPQG